MIEAGYESLLKVNILNKYYNNTYLLKTATESNVILSGNQPNTVCFYFSYEVRCCVCVDLLSCSAAKCHRQTSSKNNKIQRILPQLSLHFYQTPSASAA